MMKFEYSVQLCEVKEFSPFNQLQIGTVVNWVIALKGKMLCSINMKKWFYRNLSETENYGSIEA